MELSPEVNKIVAEFAAKYCEEHSGKIVQPLHISEVRQLVEAAIAAHETSKPEQGEEK